MSYDPYYQSQQMAMAQPMRQPMNGYGLQQMQPTYPQYNQQPPVLFGKFVDGIDVVKATELPTNIPAGIFPTPDYSKVFIKAWNKDGTASVLTYNLETQDSANAPDNTFMSEVMAKLDSIDAKLTSAQSRGRKVSNE